MSTTFTDWLRRRGPTLWQRFERAVRFLDGLAIFVGVGLGTWAITEAVTTGHYDERHGGAYLYLSGLAFVFLGLSFLPAYWGMRRKTRWRWLAQLLPLLAPALFGVLIQLPL